VPSGKVTVQTTAVAFCAVPELLVIVMPRATTSPRSKEAIDYLAFIDALEGVRELIAAADTTREAALPLVAVGWL
jgi:hypothetical protein